MRVTADHLDQVLHPQFAREGQQVHRQGPRRVAGRGGRRGVLHRRRRRRRRRARREGHPRAQRDHPRGRARHDGRRGHPHRPRRARQPRRRRRPRLGHARGRRRRGGQDRAASSSRSATSSCNEGDVISLDGTTGEVVLGAMALERRRAAGRVRRRSSGGPTRSARASSACGPTPTPARTPPTPASSAPRASACAAPSTCSSATTACPSCAAMILADTPEEETAALEELRVGAEGRLRWRSSRRWTACPSPCACSTRRCTSSCPSIEELRDQAGHRRASTPRRSALLDGGRDCGTSTTRCSAPAACASASSSPASTRCRCGR